MSHPFHKFIVPITLVATCLGVSVLLFFSVTYPGLREEEPSIRIPEMRLSRDGLAPNEPIRPETEEDNRPIELLKEAVRRLALGELEDLQAHGDPTLSESQKEALREAFASGRLQLDGNEPVTEIPHNGESDRWAINLIDTATDKRSQIVLDFGIKEGEWVVQRLQFPHLETVNPDEAESLAAARDFVMALIEGDYAKAEGTMAEGSVNSEKLAALSMVIDEAAFRLLEQEPLMATSVNEDRAWILVRLASAELGLRSEFGLEMVKDEEWRISQVNFSRMIEQFAKARNDGDAQLPMVTDPQGGELIALYFDYDTATLDARGVRQLGIVASLIKGKRDRKINIAGHTDALGEDPYNDHLSAERAEQVKRVLLDFGVSADQVTTEAYGRRKPIRPNTKDDGSDNPEGRQLNRRAEIYLDFHTEE